MKHDIERIDAEVRAVHAGQRTPIEGSCQYDYDDFTLLHICVPAEVSGASMTLQLTPVADVLLAVVGVASFTKMRRWLLSDLRVEGVEHRPIPLVDLGLLRSQLREDLITIDVPVGIAFSGLLPLIAELTPMENYANDPVDVVLVCERHPVAPQSSGDAWGSFSVPPWAESSS